jgi:hypothetical protein
MIEEINFILTIKFVIDRRITGREVNIKPAIKIIINITAINIAKGSARVCAYGLSETHRVSIGIGNPETKRHKRSSVIQFNPILIT